MTVDFLLLCQRVEETPQGTPTVVGLIDGLARSEMPIRTDLTFFTRVRADVESTVDVVLAWVDPTGQDIRVSSHRIGAEPRANYWWLTMTDLVFSRPGRYRFEVRERREVRYATELDVFLVEPRSAFKH